jgi:hypothetical protein
MKVGIMQPYFLPYLGYFQLIKSVDKFVVYDTIQYTKKGWINRNRYLSNNQPSIFSVSIKKDSNFLDVNKRLLSDDYLNHNKKTLKKLEQAYKKAPNFNEVFPLILDIFLFDKNNNLFDFIFNSLELLTNYLEVKTPLIKSSEVIGDDTNLKSKNRVVNLCRQLSADVYINPIGGVEQYDKEDFKKEGLILNFHKINKIEYDQFSDTHEPYLSILDVMMFTDAKKLLDEYQLL